MSRYFVGLFEDEQGLLKAVASLRGAGLDVKDVHTPYPVPGMDKAMGWEHSRLGWVTFTGGMVGAVGMACLEMWVAAVAWPVNIGGRPNLSLPAFFPPVFEAGVLCGALSMVGALLWSCDLFPGKTPELDLPGVNDHRFAVVLDATQKGADKISGLLKAAGALDVSEKQGVTA